MDRVITTAWGGESVTAKKSHRHGEAGVFSCPVTQGRFWVTVHRLSSRICSTNRPDCELQQWQNFFKGALLHKLKGPIPSNSLGLTMLRVFIQRNLPFLLADDHEHSEHTKDKDSETTLTILPAFKFAFSLPLTALHQKLSPLETVSLSICNKAA